ncbi:unnamed protein product [Brugia pahangi]|uniref:Secreted protein n=1 Tax=Brugia pahangi TaxID=6280 RepID=A0A0N4TTI0_BRUPA|nr:unnamed protein product [Brugia pahangi]
MEYILAGVATACWLVIAVKLIAHLMCFEPEDGKESVASTADEELAGMAEVDAVVTDGGGADSSWEYSEALSKSPAGMTQSNILMNPWIERLPIVSTSLQSLRLYRFISSFVFNLYNMNRTRNILGHDFGTSVINKKDEPVAEDEVRFISQG